MPLFFSQSVSDRASRAAGGLPVLSPGRHRSFRSGACFMEYASHLAGERWSDHPSCTHPAIGRLARLVNDKTSDTERAELVHLVPSVIGIASDDLDLSELIELHVALRAATAALPIVTADRRNPMAVTVIRCAERLNPTGPTMSDAARALAGAPVAAEWARAELASTPFRHSTTGAIPTVQMTALAVTGIHLTEIADSDAILRTLLETVIRECRDLIALHTTPPAVEGVRSPEVSSVWDRPESTGSGAGLCAPIGAQFN